MNEFYLHEKFKTERHGDWSLSVLRPVPASFGTSEEKQKLGQHGDLTMHREEWLARQGWHSRWLDRMARAWGEGVMDHTRKPEAPAFTMARYGYLVPLNSEETIQAYNAEKERLGLRGALSDTQRLEWEDRYIQDVLFGAHIQPGI